MVQMLCNFVLQQFEETGTGDAQKIKLADWINRKTVSEDNFTALHFASFNGNLMIIKFLVEYGADIHFKNKHHINVLHVAAQGDQPASIYYFWKKGLDINVVDKKLSTPLHWAAFS